MNHIRKKYEILTNKKAIDENRNFNTDYIIWLENEANEMHDELLNQAVKEDTDEYKGYFET